MPSKERSIGPFWPAMALACAMAGGWYVNQQADEPAHYIAATAEPPRTTSPAAKVAPPAVSSRIALSPDEHVSDMPNYTRPWEVSPMGMFTFVESCVAKAEKSAENDIVLRMRIRDMCNCNGDALRQNFAKHKRFEPSAPTWEQMGKCVAFAKGELYQRPFPEPRVLQDRPETAYAVYSDCKDRWLSSIPEEERRIPFCMCYADASVTGKSPEVSKEAQEKCWQIALYRDQHGKFPSPAQVASLR